MKTHDLRVFFEQISLALCGYKPTRALWKDCLDLLLTDALRGNPRRFGSFF